MTRLIHLVRIACITLWINPITAQQVNFSTSTLPIVVIDTDGEPILDEPKVTARLRIVNNGPGQINSVNGPFNDYDGWMGVEIRGQTSQFLSDKKPYGIELRDSLGNDVSKKLLGMPKESDWVLLAPFSDKSLIRDVVAFEMARRLTNLSYTPRMKMVEVVLNGAYQGVYVLGERIKRDGDRVDIAKMEETDVTGGYIIKLDKGGWWESWASSYPPLNTTAGQDIRFYYHYPKWDDITEPQKDYIEDFMYKMETALKSSQFQDAEQGYQKYLDRASFIDFMFANEISRNVDGYRISSFFYKDRDTLGYSKLHAGPVWDFNIAYGNANYCQGESTSGWAWNFNSLCGNDGWVIPFWWARLREDSNYLIESQQRWLDLRASSITDEEVIQMIDSLAALVAGAPASRNFQRWPILGTAQWPNYFVGLSHQSEVDYLKNWTIERLHWMDGAMANIYVGTYNPAQYFDPKIYPNPVHSGQNLVFDFYLKVGEALDIELRDMYGRSIGESVNTTRRNGFFRHVWSLPQLIPGTYVCTIKSLNTGEVLKTMPIIVY